jgi:hypothetical protein
VLKGIVLEVKVEFLGDRMKYIILKGRRCKFVLNEHASTVGANDDKVAAFVRN